MTHNRVFTINRRGIFSLSEAREILPIIRRITKDYCQNVENKMIQLDSLDRSNKEKIDWIEDQIDDLISTWHTKMRMLGVEPKGLWLVDFDNGSGFFCWKHPEINITHWHRYEDGYTKRQPVESTATDVEPLAR